MPGGERVFPVLRPSWDRSGIYEESEVRNAAGGGGGGGGAGGGGAEDTTWKRNGGCGM